jgi:DNA repair exonuclease SbcCD ATPase subunit
VRYRNGRRQRIFAGMATIAQKERELREAVEVRIAELESQLAEREVALAAVGSELEVLRSDFEYNLEVVDERDAQLDRLESVVDSLAHDVQSRDTDLEAARVRVTRLETALAAQRERSDRLEHRMGEERERLQSQVDDSRDAVERARVQYDTTMRERDDEVARIRQELSDSFQGVVLQQEEDFREKEELLQAQLRDLRGQLKREEQTSSAEVELAERLVAADKAVRESRKGLKEALWSLEDKESEAQARETKLAAALDDADRRYEILNTEHNSRMATLTQKCEALENRLRVADGEVRAAHERGFGEGQAEGSDSVVSWQEKCALAMAEVERLHRVVDHERSSNRTLQWELERIVQVQDGTHTHLSERLHGLEDAHETERVTTARELQERELVEERLRQRQAELEQHLRERANDLQKSRSEVDKLARELTAEQDARAAIAEELRKTTIEKEADIAKAGTEARTQQEERVQQVESQRAELASTLVGTRKQLEEARAELHAARVASQLARSHSLSDDNDDDERIEMSDRVRRQQATIEGLRRTIRDMTGELDTLAGAQKVPVSDDQAPQLAAVVRELNTVKAELVRANEEKLTLSKRVGNKPEPTSASLYELLFLRNQVQELEAQVARHRSEHMNAVAELHKQKAAALGAEREVAENRLAAENGSKIIADLQTRLRAHSGHGETVRSEGGAQSPGVFEAESSSPMQTNTNSSRTAATDTTSKSEIIDALQRRNTVLIAQMDELQRRGVQPMDMTSEDDTPAPPASMLTQTGKETTSQRARRLRLLRKARENNRENNQEREKSRSRSGSRGQKDQDTISQELLSARRLYASAVTQQKRF